MQQFEMNFDGPKQPEEMTLDELTAEYKDKVGVPPRTNDQAELIAALRDPMAEYSRLAALDREDDKDDLRRPYNGSK